MASSSILDLSKVVAENTAKYHEYLVSKGLPEPSHEPATTPVPPPELPPDIVAARDKAIEATYELHQLLIGPYGILLDGLFQSSRILSLDFIHKYKIAHLLGPNANATSSFKEIAQARSLDEEDTTRMLRLAATNNIFRESTPGTLGHTAASQVMATDSLLASWVGVATEEIWPGFLHTTEALSKWPGSQDPTQTAFSLAFNFKDIPFVEWEKDPPRAEQFSNAMKFLQQGGSTHLALSSYDFSGKSTVTLVDVGGSHGEAAMMLAQKHPQLHCIVQDFPSVIAAAEKRVPASLRERVQFQAQDFWAEQPVKGADIYFFRWVFHDWSETWALKLLKVTSTALEKGARIVIVDACIPPQEMIDKILSKKQEMDLRTVDILMKAFTNAKERDARDWEMLFQKAGAGYRFLGITTLPNSRDSIIQAEWAGE